MARSKKAQDELGSGAPDQKPIFERVFNGFQEIISDTFRLKTAKAAKNLAWQQNTYDIDYIDHQHYFHTFDRRGRESEYSTPTAGHFHKVEIKRNEAGDIVDVVCGPPVAKRPVKRGHRYVQKVVSYLKWWQEDNSVDGGFWKHDEHTHDMQYLKSSKIKQSEVNAEAAKVISRASEPSRAVEGQEPLAVK